MNKQTANWDHCLEHAELSDIGLRRSNNQDAWAVAIASSQEKWERRGHLFLVADGMGAHAAGELASKLAASIVPLSYDKLIDLPPQESLVQAVQDANTQIHSRGQASEDFRGMGTTLSALAILPQGALVAQVGDSRIYRLRGHCLEQLSFDHSLVWELRAAGRFPLSEIPNFIPKNIITRSLGPHPEIQVDLEGPYAIEAGDTFLLCSDGLSGQVTDEEIGKVLACLAPEEAVRALVDLANLNGGPDNITAIVVRITGPQVARRSAHGSEAGRIEPRPVSPVVWSLVGLFGLGFLGLLAVDMWIAAGASLVGAIVTGMVGWRLRYRVDERAFGSGVELARRGRGPYARTTCKPDAPFVARLAEIVQQLRDAATKEAWTINWEEVNAQGRSAEAAAASGNHAEAVRAYCRALTFMMAELRNQRARRPPDNGTTAAS